VIVVCGEALIDLVPVSSRPGDLLSPRLGGGPFNTAVALGRLGVPTSFFGRLSTDGFGDRLRAALGAANVDDRYAALGDEPSTLAVVQLSATGEASYRFYIDGTADRLLSDTDVPDPLPPAALAYHFGTLSLITEPGANTLERVMRKARAAGKIVAVDPNVRPALLADRREYRARLDVWLAHADIVKVSAADLGWLYPGERSSAVVDRWLGRGVKLVVVTDGATGAIATGAPGEITVPAPSVSVVDTIGAGDAFNAGLLAWLHGNQLLGAEQLSRVGRDEVAAAVGFANRVAAFTCTRAGADPPWAHELD
jgi:fructokinase